jgi:hypothetical protein
MSGRASCAAGQATWAARGFAKTRARGLYYKKEKTCLIALVTVDDSNHRANILNQNLLGEFESLPAAPAAMRTIPSDRSRP